MARAALKQRGSLQIWFDPATVWLAEPRGKRGRPATFTEYGGSENDPGDRFPDERYSGVPDAEG